METISKIEYFNCVLNLIQNEDIRNVCEKLLNEADDYFFIEPASSSGKYHPQYALGDGGLARHSIAVALIINEILLTDCYNFSDRQKDLLITAAIVHDIKKYGKGGRYTVKNHPELAVEFIMDKLKNTDIPEGEVKFLTDAVETHMGQFGKKIPVTNAQKLLHIADCLASRRYLNVDFASETIPGGIVLLESAIQLNENPGDYILTFGKYKGKKLSEVDDSYLDFLANQFQYKKHPVVNKARQFLQNGR